MRIKVWILTAQISENMIDTEKHLKHDIAISDTKNIGKIRIKWCLYHKNICTSNNSHKIILD